MTATTRDALEILGQRRRRSTQAREFERATRDRSRLRSTIAVVALVLLASCGEERVKPHKSPPGVAVDRASGETVDVCVVVHYDPTDFRRPSLISLATRPDGSNEGSLGVFDGTHTRARRETESAYLVEGHNPYTDETGVGWVSKSMASPGSCPSI